MMMMTVNLYSVLRKKAPLLRRGVATGIYRYIYPPQKKNQSTLQILLAAYTIAVLFTCGTLKCFDFEIEMTS